MKPIRHIALLVEYDGTDFHGWQSQATGRTVQQVLQSALIELTGEPDLVLYGSSRTDAGVHARGHVSHFSLTCPIPVDRVPLALNSHLPDDVAVIQACEVPADFHARFSAVGKIYTYRYWLHPYRSPLTSRQASHVHIPVDLAAMRQATRHFIGTHDFAALMDVGNPGRIRSTVRTIQALDLTQDGPMLTMTVQGNGFLYHMVRILAGTLLYVGLGKIAPGDIPAVLESRSRRRAGKTMPPQGLCLEKVFYRPDLFDSSDRMSGILFNRIYDRNGQPGCLMEDEA
jgi:tRNA pseudouridine38-40 synthase